MEQRLVCDTVKDLLPLYIDQITSEQSNQSIEEHLKHCEECKEVLAQMRQPLEVETAPEVKDFKKYLKKSRASLLSWIMGAAAVIAILTCFIVNLAVDRELSWFYIVVVSVLTAYAPSAVWIYDTGAKKYRFEKGLAVLNICVFLLLVVIQMVLYINMDMGGLWLWNMGLPIALIWSVLVWTGVAANKILHMNWVLSLGIFTLLTIPGNYFTNMLTGEWQSWEEYKPHFVANGLGNTVIAVVLLVLGVLMQMRRKKK